MKRAISALSLALSLCIALAHTARAQNGSSPVLLTFGPWAACEAGLFQADSYYCVGVTPGSETYQLIIPQGAPASVIAYRYSVTATLRSGEVRTLTGVLERAAAPAQFSFTILNFGGPLKDYSMTLQDLGVLAVTTRGRAGS